MAQLRSAGPAKPGLTVLRRYPLARARRLHRLGPFFQAWELSGPYPKILEDPVVGPAARKLFAEAQEALARIVRETLIEANGVLALYPAAQVDCDDIEIYADEEHRKEARPGTT